MSSQIHSIRVSVLQKKAAGQFDINFVYTPFHIQVGLYCSVTVATLALDGAHAALCIILKTLTLPKGNSELSRCLHLRGIAGAKKTQVSARPGAGAFQTCIASRL